MRWRLVIMMLVSVLVLFLASAALAASSEQFRVDWLVPFSGGGGTASSAGYTLNITVGQTGGSSSTSAGYSVHLGFWSLNAQDTPVFMPLVAR